MDRRHPAILEPRTNSMIEREEGWRGKALEVAHSREEAERCYQHWSKLAERLPSAEVRVWGWHAPDGSEAYVLYTQHPELPRLRTDWQRPSHELSDFGLAWLRRRRFELRTWKNGHALVNKANGSLKLATADTPYDAEQWDLVPGAWDHDHRSLCWAYICSHPDHGFAEAYFSSTRPAGCGSWVCPPCYQERVAGWTPLPLS